MAEEEGGQERGHSSIQNSFESSMDSKNILIKKADDCQQRGSNGDSVQVTNKIGKKRIKNRVKHRINYSRPNRRRRRRYRRRRRWKPDAQARKS